MEPKLLHQFSDNVFGFKLAPYMMWDVDLTPVDRRCDEPIMWAIEHCGELIYEGTKSINGQWLEDYRCYRFTDTGAVMFKLRWF